MKRAVLAFLLVSSSLTARAKTNSNAGTSGGQFLKLGADARAAAMGQAVHAASEDAAAVYWNPAGLAGLRTRHATLTHASMYQGVFYDFIAYAQPVASPFAKIGKRERDLQPDQLGSIGFAVLYLNSGQLNEVDNTGTPTGGSFAPQDFAALLSWGATLARGFDAGATLKYVSTRIQETASTGAVDAGVRWRTWLPGDTPYAVSLSVHNVGGSLKYREVADPLPVHVVVGQAVRPVKSLTLTADVTVPRDQTPYLAVGGEWRAPMQSGLSAALRAGYNGRLAGSGLSGASGIAFGGGLGVNRFAFDYAWSPVGFLGDTHRLTLSYRF